MKIICNYTKLCTGLFLTNNRALIYNLSKIVDQVMLVAGSETSATAMECALSLLLNHPEAMHKTKVEIDTYVGQDQLLIEQDIAKLKLIAKRNHRDTSAISCGSTHDTPRVLQ